VSRQPSQTPPATTTSSLPSLLLITPHLGTIHQLHLIPDKENCLLLLALSSRIFLLACSLT
jgi:hypothetical protein